MDTLFRHIVGAIPKFIFLPYENGMIADGISYTLNNNVISLSFINYPPFKQWNGIFKIDTSNVNITRCEQLYHESNWIYFLPDSLELINTNFTVSILVPPSNPLTDTINNFHFLGFYFQGKVNGIQLDSIWVIK